MGWKRRYRYKYLWGVLQITFRVATDGTIDVRLDDCFALAVGYMDARGMLKCCKPMDGVTNKYWARVEKGKVYFYVSDGFRLWKKIDWLKDISFD